MAAADVYPAALFDLYRLSNRLNELAQEAEAIRDDLAEAIETLGIAPRFATSEASGGVLDPVLRRARAAGTVTAANAIANERAVTGWTGRYERGAERA